MKNHQTPLPVPPTEQEACRQRGRSSHGSGNRRPEVEALAGVESVSLPSSLCPHMEEELGLSGVSLTRALTHSWGPTPVTSSLPVPPPPAPPPGSGERGHRRSVHGSWESLAADIGYSDGQPRPGHKAKLGRENLKVHFRKSWEVKPKPDMC